MSNFVCPRCLKEVSRRCDLKKHINIKTMCNLAKKGFDIDVKEDNNQDIILGRINPLDYFYLMLENKRINELENMVKKLQVKLKDKDKDSKIITNYNTDNSITTHNNINIIINNYTSPNTDYILSKHCDAALKNGNLAEGCLQMARLIWFNSNHPENHCMYMNNKKERSIKCIENGQENEYKFDYKFKTIMDKILEVCERAEKESDRYYDLNDIFDNPDKAEYQKIYKEIEASLGNELYNKKDIVKETIKQFREQRHKILN